MDDFIVGGGNFDEVIAQALTIAQWEKQFYNDCTQVTRLNSSGRKDEPPTPVEFAIELAKAERYRWRFNNEWKTWLEWNEQYWQIIPEEKVADYIHHQAKHFIKTDRWVTDCLKSLERELRQFQWFSPSQIATPFRNGVVNLNTLTIKPHDPENYNTNVIDRDWWTPDGEPIKDPIEALKAYCPNIYQAWHYAMNGDERKIFKLLAICHGVMTWRFSFLHHFVHLIGEPRAGKGTFIRLLQLLVGEGNHYGGKLKTLSNPNKMAMYMDKQLLACADEKEIPSTEVTDVVKSLSGRDRLDFCKKFKDWASSAFYGSLVIASNDPIFRKDSKAIGSRTCLVEFNRPIRERNGDVELLMQNEASQLTYIALSLSKSEVDQAIKGTGDYQVASCQSKRWEMECETNSVAAYLDECLVAMPGNEIGQKEAYQSYRTYCQDSGVLAVAQKEFWKRLSAAANFVGLSIERRRIGAGQKLRGVAKREEVRDLSTPTFFQQLEVQEKQKMATHSTYSTQPSQGKGSEQHPNQHCVESSVESEGAETTVYQESVECVESSSNPSSYHAQEQPDFSASQEDVPGDSPPELRLGMKVRNRGLDMELFNEGVLTLPPGEDGEWGVFWEHFDRNSREHPDNLIPIVD